MHNVSEFIGQVIPNELFKKGYISPISGESDEPYINESFPESIYLQMLVDTEVDITLTKNVMEDDNIRLRISKNNKVTKTFIYDNINTKYTTEEIGTKLSAINMNGDESIQWMVTKS